MMQSHISDCDLVQFLDGELNPADQQEVNDHLGECWQCRSRAGELESSIRDFMRMKADELDAKVPDASGPGALLRARMSATAQDRRGSLWRVLAVALPVIAVSAYAIANLALPRVDSGQLPNTRLTPGATRLISRAEVCALPPQVEEAQPKPALAAEVFRKYKIANPQPGAYELDYLIDPLLGGAEDARNLWPQPYAEGVWNSRIKDALEDLLRSKVCQGQMELDAAQAELAANWVASYQKHFGTQRPLPAHLLFVKDEPWQQALTK